MQIEYFVVGPRFELAHTFPAMPTPDTAFPCRFAATRSGTLIGDLHATREQRHCLLRIEAVQSLSADEQAELYKLFARVCVRLGQHELPLALPAPADPQLAALLAAEGFASDTPDLWMRPPTPFVLPATAKGDTMDDVYSDPFYIPWNFVPREWDMLERVVAAGTQIQSAQGTRPARLLDLGCGFGKNAVRLETLGFETYGLDIAASAIERCRQLVRFPERFVAGSATALPWDDQTFDRVLDIGCIHCLPRDLVGTALKELARVLKPEGLLFSRIFKPRPVAWLEAQPFKTTRFGYTEDEAGALLSPSFKLVDLQSDADKMYVQCRPAVDL